MLEVNQLSFSYQVSDQTLEVLKNLNLKVEAGEFIGIQGPSGSGKSTLFYILGFLLKPTYGKIIFKGKDLSKISKDELAAIRNQSIGFIFQQFHLLPNLNCLKNILLPTVYPCETRKLDPYREKKAKELASQLGLSKYLNHMPHQLSGGQQQRVAIARALIHDVDLILADEPTGSLDSQTATHLMTFLSDLHSKGKTIILITHDSVVAQYCSKVYDLKEGAFTHFKEDERKLQKDRVVQEAQVKQFFFPQRGSLKVDYKILKSTLTLAKENLFRNPSKALLNMLGVSMGIATLLAMMTLGKFSKDKILQTYETLGVDQILIRGYPNWNRQATDVVPVNFESFDFERDLLPLKKIFEAVQMVSPVYRISQNNVTFGGIRIENRVETFGINHEYLWMTNRALLAGTSMSPYHVEYGSSVCIVGHDIAKRLFVHTGALGQMINVTDNFRLNYYCRVIGVLAPQKSSQDFSDRNLHVFIPYTYFRTIAPNWWFAGAHEASLKIAPGQDVETYGSHIKSYFEKKYGKSGDFSIDSNSQIIAQMRKILNIFNIFLISISFISLLLGGIGIHNMILVSITDRIKEFGLRKALGATDRSIRFQVLLESLSLCTLAGFFGVFIGFVFYELLIYGASKLIPNIIFEWFFSPFAIFISAFSIVIVGIFSGLSPALRAEKLQIIEALRSE